MPETWCRGACPACDHPDAFARHPSGFALCHRCGRRSRGDGPIPGPDPASRSEAAERARALLAESEPVAPTNAAGRYLLSRGLRLPAGGHDPLVAEVRHVEWCWHPRERDWLHALVAAVRDVDGRLVAVSRLFLDDSGRKARCRPVRMFLGAVTGAAFKTSGPGVRGRVVTLCEGVEDALAASMIWPWRWAWACLSAGGLERVELPAGMSAVIVPDRDRVGMLAARRAADRLRGEGRLVEIVEPPLGDACESLQLCDLLGLEATAL